MAVADRLIRVWGFMDGGRGRLKDFNMISDRERSEGQRSIVD